MDYKANSPVGHWRSQRWTAIVLTPLTIFLLIFLQKAFHAPYHETVAWLATPLNSLAIFVWLSAALYHAALGLQVVLEDYVSRVALRRQLILASNLLFFLLAITALIAIFNILS